MKHSKVVPLVVMKRERLSILQISEHIIKFYQKLAEGNPSYNIVNVISEKDALSPVINIQESDSIQILAKEILHQNLDDIKKIDGVDDPSLDYIRNEKGGIHIGLETKIKEETLITITYSFYPNRTAIGPLVVNESCFDTFEKAKYFLTAANSVFPVQYSVIKISDRLLNKVARGYKAPLGWITYFSCDYEVPIPDELNGIEYEFVDQGKFLILSREDISVDEGKLELQKNKLIKLMEKVEIESPSYSMTFTPPLA